jgi:SAM-dependent methyltransferase
VSPFPWLPTRRRDGELLDDPDEWGSNVRGNLDELARTNRWFGGLGSLCGALRPLLERSGARILDVGTADGATLTSVGRWAASRGAQWDLYGVDLFPALLSLAGSSPGFRRCAGDALSLPFPDRTFDATICLQTLHHFDDPCAVAVLRELARVSNELVVVSDLRRSLSTYAAARGLAVLYWRNAMTRHDGPRSVRAAFTPPELLALARRAGPEEWQVRAHGPFRLVLECTRAPEAPS